ncbi:MAG: hypothetical protein SGJ20_16805, partial [Planctomycetota bacterium]|nr:hypothetical protein [Planctomycetota bacterium]
QTTLTDRRAGLRHGTRYHQLIGEVDAAIDHRIYRNPVSRVKKNTPVPSYYWFKPAPLALIRRHTVFQSRRNGDTFLLSSCIIIKTL